MSTALPEFVIARTLAAPRDRVWAAHTDIAQLKQWWGPAGLEMFDVSLDLKPGGLFHYGMRLPNGGEMWGKFVYREITPPSRLVFVNSFSDARKGVTRHPMSATWPLTVLSTLTFDEVGDTPGQATRWTLRGVPLDANAEECATFAAGTASMQQGFGGTLAQLERFLARP